MEATTTGKNSENGSAVPSLEAKGTQLANLQVSKRDLKMLSLDYIGEVDGTYYFRNPADPTRTFSGDREDYVAWRVARAQHPLIDQQTANATLQMQQMAKEMEMIFA